MLATWEKLNYCQETQSRKLRRKCINRFWFICTSKNFVNVSHSIHFLEMFIIPHLGLLKTIDLLVSFFMDPIGILPGMFGWVDFLSVKWNYSLWARITSAPARDVSATYIPSVFRNLAVYLAPGLEWDISFFQFLCHSLLICTMGIIRSPLSRGSES